MSAPENNSAVGRTTVYIDLTRCGYRAGPRTLSPTPIYAEVMAGKMTEIAHAIGLMGIRDIEVAFPQVDGWMELTVNTADAVAVRIAYASPPANQIAEYEAVKAAEIALTNARKGLSVHVLSLPWSNPNEPYATTVPRSFVRRVVDRVRGWFR